MIPTLLSGRQGRTSMTGVCLVKMSEWIGRLVKLRKRMQTEGGDVFVPGEVMVVTGHHRGRLYLNRPAHTDASAMKNRGHVIKGVHREYDVELLPNKPGKILKAMLEGIEILAKSCGGVLAYEIEEGGKTKLGKFDAKKVMMLQSVDAAAGVVRDEDGMPTALMLG